MKMAIMAVSRQGYALAERIQAFCPGAEVHGFGAWRQSERPEGETDLKTLTGDLFKTADALVFVSAVGIAVRMIAPFLKGKDQDPAVLVVDDGGRWVIPILSGHLGGANPLAEALASKLGAQAVVTTATDGRGLTAVDLLALEMNARIADLTAAKEATAALLEGETLAVEAWRPLALSLPAGYRYLEGNPSEDTWLVRVTPYRHPLRAREVWLIPKVICVGIGCRRGTPRDVLAQGLSEALEGYGIPPAAIRCLATADLKKDEPGLLALAETLDVPLVTYPSEALDSVSWRFETSAFVKSVAGTGSVSEAAGWLASGGRCLGPRIAGNGMTLSIWEDN